MAFELHVQAVPWRSRVRDLVEADAIIPVVKGNGYGFGLAVLAEECERLRTEPRLDVTDLVDLVAVGTYADVAPVRSRYAGDLLVLEPFRAVLAGPAGRAGLAEQQQHDGLAAQQEHDVLADPRIIHTVTNHDDLVDLARRVPRVRVAVEGLTAMFRFGAAPGDARVLVESIGSGVDAVLEAVTLHLPLGSGHESEVRRWFDSLPDQRTWYVSHLTPAELGRLRTAYPHVTIRPRVGTHLWLGDASTWRYVSHVLDVRPVGRGQRAGYRQRKMREGTLLVVSGGTAHGVAMEAPSAVASPRQRAIAVAEGMLEAAGRVRSPFTVNGKETMFVEPPHMQVSLVHCPEGMPVPSVGDVLAVRMRATTAYPDRVVFET